MAARAVSTLDPSVQKPCSSGGLTVMRATSRFTILRRKSRGISLTKIGTKSARPSAIALRQLAPMKSELDRKISAKKKNNITHFLS